MNNKVSLIKTDIFESGMSDITRITGCVDLLPNKLLLSTKHTAKPLFEYKYKLDNTIESTQENLNMLRGEKISFITNVLNGFGVTLDGTFEIQYYNNIYENIGFFKYNHSKNLRQMILEKICVSQHCVTDGCYKLSGYYTRFNKIYFIISKTCCHNRKDKKIYILKATIDINYLTIHPDIMLESHYDLYTIARTNKISKKKSLELKVSSITLNNDYIYILTSYGKGGFLWNITVSLTLNYVGAGMNLIKNDGKRLDILNNPVCITQLKMKDLIVVCQNNNGRVPYYTIRIETHSDATEPVHIDHDNCKKPNHHKNCKCHKYNSFVVCDKKKEIKHDIYTVVDYSQKCTKYQRPLVT